MPDRERTDRFQRQEHPRPLGTIKSLPKYSAMDTIRFELPEPSAILGLSAGGMP